MLALEQGSRLLPPEGGRADADEGKRRLLDELRPADGGRKVVRSVWKLRRFRIAADPPDHGVHNPGTRSQHVVLEIVGEIKCCTRMFERSHVSRSKACRPRESAMDERLERRSRLRLTKGFLEQHHATVDTLELSEQDERLGAQRTDFRLGEQIGRDRPGTRPLTGNVVCTSRVERSTMALFAPVERRQSERVLGELGRDGRRAPVACKARGVVEHVGDDAVR